MVEAKRRATWPVCTVSRSPRPFAEALRAAQVLGNVRRDCDPDDMAVFLMSAWHGALLRMKVERSGEAIKQFKRVLFQVLSDSPGKVVVR